MKMDDRMTYAATVTALAAELKMDDHRLLQLTSYEPATRYNMIAGPGDKILSKTAYKLHDIAYVPYTRNAKKNDPIVYYEKIPTPIAEFESLTEFEVQVLDTSKAMSVTTYKVHGPADQTAADLIRQVFAAADSDWQLMNCRLVQTYWNRYTELNIPHDKRISALTATYEQLRVEVIPEDERAPPLGVESKPVEVVHVTKFLHRRHGIPFMFMLQNNESVKDLKARIGAYIKAPKAEFEKWGIGKVVQFRNKMGTMEDDIEYFEDEEEIINFAELAADPMLILDHVDKSKSDNGFGNPGAIKIHN